MVSNRILQEFLGRIGPMGSKGLGTLLVAACIGLPAAGHAQQPAQLQFQVSAFVIDGDSPLPPQTLDELLAQYGNRQYDLDSLQRVAGAVESAIRDAGYAFHRVVVPPQTLDQGTVHLRIVPFVLGSTRVESNTHFSEQSIRRSLPGLVEGSSPNTSELARELKVANRHPSKELKLAFRQGKEPGGVDATISVDDQKPGQLSLIGTNTGSEDTGDVRSTLAYQQTDLWGKDHILSTSYTTSPGHWSDVKQYGLGYTAPAYGRGAWISAYAVHSSVDSGTISNVFDVSGAGDMFGLHWLQSLARIGRYEHWIDIGIDTRHFDSDITTPASGSSVVGDVRSTPASIAYQGEYQWPATRASFQLRYSRNTGWGDDNEDDNYGPGPAGGGRIGAADDWDALALGAMLDRALADKWALHADINVQYSNDALISGEQLGLGGSTSVRGYQERESSADEGFVVRLELSRPAWREIIGVAFADYGRGRVRKAQPGETEDWDLASVGIGARWQWRQLRASADVACVLEDAPLNADTTKSGDVHAHVSIALLL